MTQNQPPPIKKVEVPEDVAAKVLAEVLKDAEKTQPKDASGKPSAMASKSKLRKILPKLAIALLVFLLLSAGSLTAHTIWQNHQPVYVVGQLNAALIKKDLMALTEYFDTQGMLASFVNKFHPVQTYFVRDQSNHTIIEESVLLTQAQGIFLAMSLAPMTDVPSPTIAASDTAMLPEASNTATPPAAKPKKHIIPGYRLFAMPQLIPASLLDLLGDSQFTLQSHDEDNAIIAINIVHPTLRILIPVKLLMVRNMLGWQVQLVTNPYVILTQISNLIKGLKQKSIDDFHATNQTIADTLAQYFASTSCIALMAKNANSRDVMLMLTVEAENNGKYPVRSTALDITLTTANGNFIGDIPVSFTKILRNGSKGASTWIKELKSVQRYAPHILTTSSLVCTAKARQITLENGLRVSKLNKNLLEGL